MQRKDKEVGGRVGLEGFRVAREMPSNAAMMDVHVVLV